MKSDDRHAEGGGLDSKPFFADRKTTNATQTEDACFDDACFGVDRKCAVGKGTPDARIFCGICGKEARLRGPFSVYLA